MAANADRDLPLNGVTEKWRSSRGAACWIRNGTVFRSSESGKQLQDVDQQRIYKFALLRPHLLDMSPEMMFLGVVLVPIPVGRLISHRLYPAGETAGNEAGIAVTRAEDACSFPPAENRGPLHVEHRALFAGNVL